MKGNMEYLELTSLIEVEQYFNGLKEKGIKTIALDIECEMNLHCYGEHICLVQIYDGEQSVIFDPLAIDDYDDLIDSYRLIFQNREVMKLTYDVGSDDSILQKLSGVKYNSVYDLRPAVSLLEFEKQGLNNVLNSELGVPIVAKKKFQMYNWMKRPIDPEALEYAIADVTHLFALKDKLMFKIVQYNLLDEFMHMNLMAQNRELVKPTEEEFFNKKKGYKNLNSKYKARFKDFYKIREEYAEKTNNPPNSIFQNSELFSLAKKDGDFQNFINNKITYRMPKSMRKEFIGKLIDMYNS